MVSTFGGLSTAASALAAARAAMDTTGQNLANARTEGYTRQRVHQTALGAPAPTRASGAAMPVPGQGVAVTSIERLGSTLLDDSVRYSSGASGYSSTYADALVALEDTFHEPGDNGLSATLQSFWSSWQALSNTPDNPSAATVVLQRADTLTQRIAAGYLAADDQWSAHRAAVDSLAAELNAGASRVADLNAKIRTVQAAGGSVNELLDQRSVITTRLASIAGARAVESGDGMVNVFVGGNLLVSGTNTNSVEVVGTRTMAELPADAVHLEWSAHPGRAVGLDRGSLAAHLALLAPASPAGDGGPLAQAGRLYDDLAQRLVDTVNAAHRTGYTADGDTGLDFFTINGSPAALGLDVVPDGPDDVATSALGDGSLDGGAADAISRIGKAPDSPDSAWIDFVSSTAVRSQGMQGVARLDKASLDSAVGQQQSQASVDIDEEQTNLLAQQSAYAAAARVLTALDQALDTLINKTGVVGR